MFHRILIGLFCIIAGERALSGETQPPGGTTVVDQGVALYNSWIKEPSEPKKERLCDELRRLMPKLLPRLADPKNENEKVVTDILLMLGATGIDSAIVLCSRLYVTSNLMIPLTEKIFGNAK